MTHPETHNTQPAHASKHLLRQTVRKLMRRPAASAIAMLGFPGIALAGPDGGVVVRGAADITRPDANTTNIDQYTNRAVINWDSFNVGSDEFVIFNQLDASSIVLNRVLGGDASTILGHIEANGQVFLLNPQGVFFGEGASIDVQGFLGSTLDMNDDDFMAGDFTLSRTLPDSSTGQVVNEGTITAGEGGYVLLAGDFTENTGVVTAMAGTVALVSGNELTLNIEGDGLVNFSVNADTLAEASGVRNAGSLIADGGMVVMTARVANDLVATAVNNEGLVRARSIEESNGEIYLIGRGGNIEQSGTLDANGENADGGRIILYGDRDITLADGGVQTATGDADHSGGTVRAIAEEHLDFQAGNTMEATGDASGGFVEVSGHDSIALRGVVNVGRGGTYLIDPSSINIVAGSATGSVGTVGVNLITTQLNLGANVVLAASNQITTAVASLNATGSGDLTLGIGTMTGGVGGSCIGLGSSLCFGPNPTFTPSTGGFINISGMDISIAGDVDIIAQQGTATVGNVTTTNGSITIDTGTINANTLSAGSDVTLNAVGGFSSGRINVTGAAGIIAGGDISMTATASYGGGVIDVTGPVNAGGLINALASNSSGNGGDILIGDNVFANGNVSLAANANGSSGGSVFINGDVSGSSINLSANGTSNRVVVDIGNATATAGDLTLEARITDNGGDADIFAATLNAAGDVSVDATAGSSFGAGSASIGSVTAGGRADIYAGAVVADSIVINGDVNAGAGIWVWNRTDGNVTINGSVSGGGFVLLEADGVSTGQGNIKVEGNIAGSSVEVRAGGGIIDIGSGSRENNYLAGDVTATSGNVNLHLSGNTLGSNGGIIVAGNVVATGDVAITATTGQGHVHLGDYANSGATFTAASVNAGGGINIQALGSVAQLDVKDLLAGTGNLNVSAGSSSGTLDLGNLSGTQVFVQTQGASLVTGNITANNAAGPGIVELNTQGLSSTGGSITVNGNISATGMATGSQSLAAGVDLAPAFSNGALVTVTGTTSITGNAGQVSYGDGSISGSMGAVFLQVDTGNGTVNFGDVVMNGVGNGSVLISGVDVTVGNVTANIAGADFERQAFGLGSSISESVTGGGIFSMNLFGLGFSSASLTLGDVAITAPQAGVGIVDFLDVSGGNISVTANGQVSSLTTSGTNDGIPYGVTETQDGGIAQMRVDNDEGGSINFGDVTISGEGLAALSLDAASITVGAISLDGGSGSFTRSGTPGPGRVQGPMNMTNSIWEAEEGIGGPKLDLGSIQGGAAFLQIQDRDSDGLEGSVGTFTAQDITLNASGNAMAFIQATDITTGNVSFTAGAAIQTGTFKEFDSGSQGSGSFERIGSFDGSYGEARLEIINDRTGTVDMGNVSLTGPDASGAIEGGVVDVGNVTITALGGSVDFEETLTDLGAGTSTVSSIVGPNLLAAFGLNADTSLTAGDISITGNGGGGMGISAPTASLGDISIDVANATYTAQLQGFFGGAETTFTIGDAVLSMDVPNPSMGSITINADGRASVGGPLIASGAVSITAGSGISRNVRQGVNLLEAVRDDGGSGITLPGATDIVGTSVSLLSASGNVQLSNMDIVTPGALEISGGTLDDGGAGGSWQAGAVALQASTSISLATTTITAGAGTQSLIAGDPLLLTLLQQDGLTPVAATPNFAVSAPTVTLGDFSVAGDYLYFEANRLVFAGTPEINGTLVQMTPTTSTNTISLSQSGTGPGQTHYTNVAHLSFFQGATLALGDTGHTGEMIIGADGQPIDIGNSNFFALSRSSVRGLENIISTGIVKDLNTLLGAGFEVPQTDEIDVSQSLANELARDYRTDGEGEEEGEEEGEDTDDDTGIEEEDDSLIRQDTIDEELTCS